MYYLPLYSPHLYPLYNNVMPCLAYFPQQTSPSLHMLPPPASSHESAHESSTSLPCLISPLPKKSVLSLEKKQKIKKEESATQVKETFVQKRNIIPNNINHILSFVQRKNKSLFLVERIISNAKGRKDGFNAKRFYAYQFLIKGKLSVHVSKATLLNLLEHFDPCSDIFPLDEQAFYNKVCRVLVRHYLEAIAPLVTLHSRRLVQTTKKDHLRAQRNLARHIERVLNAQQTSF